jgi:pyruvate/2-oxoglutarate dehydrogenase complex dihydrolipoamide acyltransferase (E2) component
VLIGSPLTGVVVEVVSGEGERVAAGSAVLVLESMKMHHEVVAPSAGVVRELAVGVGDQVEAEQGLFRIELAAGDGAGGSSPHAPLHSPAELRGRSPRAKRGRCR